MLIPARMQLPGVVRGPDGLIGEFSLPQGNPTQPVIISQSEVQRSHTLHRYSCTVSYLDTCTVPVLVQYPAGAGSVALCVPMTHEKPWESMKLCVALRLVSCGLAPPDAAAPEAAGLPLGPPPPVDLRIVRPPRLETMLCKGE